MKDVVFFHGWLGTPDDWQGITSGLTGYRSSCPSLPVNRTWEAGVHGLARQLPPQAVLVGYSLGARLALGCALQAAVPLRGLVLISGTAGLPVSAQADRWRQDQQVAERLQQEPPQEFLIRWYHQPIFRSLTPELREQLVRERAQVDRPYQAALLRGYSVGRQPNLWSDLPSMRQPVLLIVGQHDAKFVAIAKEMQRALPQAWLRVIPQAGHAVHREHPQAVLATLQEFLSQLPLENLPDG